MRAAGRENYYNPRMDSKAAAVLVFLMGAALSVACFFWLQRLDPPKEEGESRFEGVMPNLRGAKIAVAYAGLVLGLIGMIIIAAMLYLR